MIAIIDYGVGNLFSLKSSFAAIGADTVVTGDPGLIRSAEKLILPGVGAFGDAAALLRRDGLDKLVKEEALAGKPLLGICLGMQLLLDYSTEYGRHRGLGLIPGVHPGGVQDPPHRLERPTFPRREAGEPAVPAYPGRRVRVLRPLLLWGGV